MCTCSRDREPLDASSISWGLTIIAASAVAAMVWSTHGWSAPWLSRIPKSGEDQVALCHIKCPPPTNVETTRGYCVSHTCDDRR